MQRFAGKTVLVTGAASGIGRATAARLASEGATVVASDVAAGGLESLATEAGPSILTAVGDVSDEAFAPTLVATALDRTGRLDAVANVAGILRTAHSHEHSLDLWEQVLRVNLTGTFLVCRAAIPALLEGGGGAIVNTASTAALAGHPWAAAYSASKGGVLAFTKVLAVEYGKQGLRANCVCPGSIDTPITGDFDFPEGADARLLRRIMALDKPRGPEYVAAAIAYLASDEAAHVNGEDLRIDGGTLA